MASITVNFVGSTATSNNCTIILGDGVYRLDVSDGLGISGTTGISALFVTSDTISLEVGTGASFDAQVEVDVASTSPGTAPTIDVNNIQGTVMVTWPTSTGMQTQTLLPGLPVTLSGYTG